MLIFKGTKGLNTKIDPARIEFNLEAGVQDLAACKNVDVDDTGRISRRKGFEKKISGNYHSGFSCGDYSLCVTGDALTIIEQDYSILPIRQVTVGRRMSYVRVGSEIYYANGVETGFVRDRISYSWVKTLELREVTTRILSSPPVGHLLGFYNGRVYIAVGNTLYYTEANSRNHVDLASNVIIESSRIRMIAPVDGGVYVGNDREILFYSGESPKTFTRKVVANYPVIEGTETTVMVSQVGEMEEGGKVVLIATEQGLSIGFPDGKFVNFSEDKISYPSARYGAGVFKDRKYIVTMQN